MAQKCLFKFQTESDYNTAKENGLITPNISMIVETGNTYINADVAVTAYYNVQDITGPTTICGETSGFKSIEVDGVLLDDVKTAYQFDTTGEHVIKYEFNEPKVISNNAFYNCTDLTSITIGSSVTSIGGGVFSDCTGLTSISIPDSVRSIGEAAFLDCSSLINIIIPSSVTSICNSTFRNCSNLTSITIPSSVTSIGKEAFMNCSSLTNVTIPSSVTSIGGDAFSGCSGLTNVTIPSSVTSIDEFAFSGCIGLTSITVEATTPPTLADGPFGSTNNCPIYVPAASVETYKSASGWSDYASRIQAIQ